MEEQKKKIEKLYKEKQNKAKNNKLNFLILKYKNMKNKKI